MLRFAFFVDGSNMFGALKALNVEIDEYDKLFGYLFAEAHRVWQEVTNAPAIAQTELRRIYWYAVGTIDEWDLDLPQSHTALRKAFTADKAVRDYWLSVVGKANPGMTGTELDDKAWAACFKDFREWYEKRRELLDGIRRFHQGVRISTDLIDIIEAGHWKVDFIHKSVSEKGLDTSLAVDMVALQGNYDVAVVVSGDADSIPSIRHLKSCNKHVAVVEFISGSPPEEKGRTFSSRLREHADFVVRIYETELLRLKIATRPSPCAAGPTP
jgi:uncharacterized LabA/DUF88 family protein